MINDRDWADTLIRVTFDFHPHDVHDDLVKMDLGSPVHLYITVDDVGI